MLLGITFSVLFLLACAAFNSASHMLYIFNIINVAFFLFLFSALYTTFSFPSRRVECSQTFCLYFYFLLLLLIFFFYNSENKHNGRAKKKKKKNCYSRFFSCCRVEQGQQQKQQKIKNGPFEVKSTTRILAAAEVDTVVLGFRSAVRSCYSFFP